MRMLCVAALFVGLCASFSGGQQASPSAPPPMPDTQPASVKVYSVGPGVTAPELLPLNVTNFAAKGCKKMDGKVALSVLVDEKGMPHYPMFLKPLGSALDQFALQIANADRFKPGTYEGAPVVVAESVEIELQACVENKKDDAGIETYSLRLRSQPVQNFEPLPNPPEEAVLTAVNSVWKDTGGADIPVNRVGRGVTAPVVLNSVEAEFSDEAKQTRYQGACLLSLIVDANGMPQNVRVLRPLKYGLTEKAIEAVNKYRFKPAMKDGMPIPVMINVEVNFHLY